MTTVIKTDMSGKRSGYSTWKQIHIDSEFIADANLKTLELSIQNDEGGILELRFDRCQFAI